MIRELIVRSAKVHGLKVRNGIVHVLKVLNAKVCWLEVRIILRLRLLIILHHRNVWYICFLLIWTKLLCQNYIYKSALFVNVGNNDLSADSVALR